MGKKLIKILFIFYIIALSVLLLFKDGLSMDGLSAYAILEKIDSVKWSREHGTWNINLIPLRSISVELLHLNEMWALKNLCANIFAFIPFGIFLPLTIPAIKKFYQVVLIGFIYILVIESLQFFCMLGSFDVDDFILNSIGVISGYFIYKIFKQNRKSNWHFIN